VVLLVLHWLRAAQLSRERVALSCRAVHVGCIRCQLALLSWPRRTNNSLRCRPVEGLDYGGPAVVEPRLPRPETLRRRLSAGLPFANPRALPDVFIGRSYQ